MQLGISNAGERVFHYEVMSSYTLVLLLPLLLGYIQQQTYMFAVPFHRSEERRVGKECRL